MIKISVIIPTFNCGKYISDAIKSVLSQRYTDYEIIVVDDGSIDNTKDILHSYIDKGIVKYIYQKNKGLPGARNTGIKEAKGEFIALLDADDEFMPGTLDKCFSAINQSGADWCITDILRLENGKEEIKRSQVPVDNYLINILKRDFIRWAVFFKKKVLFEIDLYDEAMINREDWDINIRLIEANKKFLYIPEPLYKYKIRKKSITKNNTKKILFFTLKLLQKHHKNLADSGNKQVAKIYSQNMWDLAREFLYELKDIKSFIYCIKESMKYDFDLKRLIKPLILRFKKTR
ncbi:MAG: glycosyltransferase [Candidatus Omnitrophota bacterium]|nr:glycosyltransferase [Candidatus Omnitrophota bacterium]